MSVTWSKCWILQVTVPCHILQSNKDLAVPVEVSAYLHNTLGGPTIVEVLQTEGHLPQLSSPEVVIPVLKRHIAGRLSMPIAFEWRMEFGDNANIVTPLILCTDREGFRRAVFDWPSREMRKRVVLLAVFSLGDCNILILRNYSANYVSPVANVDSKVNMEGWLHERFFLMSTNPKMVLPYLELKQFPFARPNISTNFDVPVSVF